jgi:hypothetical protein
MGPWTFTNAGATGRLGPTQAQIDANYSGTSLEGAVTINATHQGIQEWTVPASGTYRITAFGGSDGWNEGLGAKLRGDYELNADQRLFILVGQKGSIGDGSGNWCASGGGGGTFVVSAADFSSITSIDLLIVAGGAGGSNASGGNVGNLGEDANIVQTISPLDFSGGTGSGNGGGGGAGFENNGNTTNSSTSLSFLNGGIGGSPNSPSYTGFGGFGGGGAGGGNPGGGGGGLSGGDYGTLGFESTGTYDFGGKAGTSYNSGESRLNEGGVNAGHGKVIIRYIGN